MNSRFLSIFIVLISFLSSTSNANENESAKTDILFLKIQELELEIAELRNKIESQNYLIEKLIDESMNSSDEESGNIDDLGIDTDIRFKGIEDPNSKDQVFSAADQALRAQDYDKAFTLFNFFVKSFNDDEKKPLSYFWLGEISAASQFGDLFISLLKRKAKLKDTGYFLPGHGGILDRIDGILIGLPVGLILFILFIK